MTQQTSSRPDHVLTYAALAERATKVRCILSARDIKIHRDSALSKTLGQAESLPEAWMDEAKHATSGGHLVEAANASRIAEAVIAVENDSIAASSSINSGSSRGNAMSVGLIGRLHKPSLAPKQLEAQCADRGSTPESVQREDELTRKRR